MISYNHITYIPIYLLRRSARNLSSIERPGSSPVRGAMTLDSCTTWSAESRDFFSISFRCLVTSKGRAKTTRQGKDRQKTPVGRMVSRMEKMLEIISDIYIYINIELMLSRYMIYHDRPIVTQSLFWNQLRTEGGPPDLQIAIGFWPYHQRSSRYEHSWDKSWILNW